ncbi:leucine-zipper-like transcriptional regulator 1 homolog isoform X2 [Conger conger]|uniref:leucine-zipper-like transcriptional regulator 1 homolog isoform X2 n=1 Tax=Conger conger TaxID=82655 RepID=UPI002A59A09E|nr:leucine-zipper-like transcriptional regulator 1 homolog isoform X2 [Conger conger]
MSLKRGPCLWTPIPQSGPVPCDRYKHSCCAHGDSVYLLGGRGKSLLSDFWRYNVVRNEWTELDCSCENAPEETEEHSMVNYQGLLFIFGGMIDSGYSGNKTPLWVYDTDKEEWLCWQGKNTQLAPVNRKGHSAVVFESSMYIYGGYIDMKGPSQEFWRLDFDTEAWSDLTPDEAGPGPRHGHSAATHQDCMYLFGGLTGLREQSDLWRWSFSTHSWSSIRSLSGPSKLVGHSAVVYQDNMLLFGGGAAQSPSRNGLWRFSFPTQVWERLAAITASSPPCKMHHCIAGLGPSYRPQPQSSHTPPGEGPLGRPRPAGAKLRPFKNRCFPTEGSIELETFCVENRHGAPPHADTRIHPASLKGSCLTFENQEAFGKGCDCEDGSSAEDVTFHLPDLLLVLGGRPMGANPGISMWQLTLSDL